MPVVISQLPVKRLIGNTIKCTCDRAAMRFQRPARLSDATGLMVQPCSLM